MNPFQYTFELVPARASKGKVLDEILLFAEKAASNGLLSALSITDNAGGHPALSPTALGREIKAVGIRPIIHFSCKDKNRNLIESQLFELDRHRLWDLLVLTGDYPRFGYKGFPKPVFDLDSVSVLELITQMKQGFVLDPRAPGGGMTLPPMPFRPGCVVSPFKRTQGELVGQYLKLKRKVEAGAQFVMTQMGFDARKFQELLFFMEEAGLNIPVFGTVFIPTKGIARVIHKGVIPGCVLPTRLLERIERWDGEKGGRERLEFGARLISVLRGLGYQGVHISGPHLTYEDCAWMIQRSEDIKDNWWDFVHEFQFEDEWGFFLYEKDERTGLNKKERTSQGSKRGAGFKDIFAYRAGHLFHKLFFQEERALYPVMKWVVKRISGTRLEGPFTAFEELIKVVLFDCDMCGNCTLFDFAYLCPQSQCAKGLLNGPCGGSRDGWCEVWPGRKRCFYVRVFERLSTLKKECSFMKRRLPPRDWEQWKRSSWINFYERKF